MSGLVSGLVAGLVCGWASMWVDLYVALWLGVGYSVGQLVVVWYVTGCKMLTAWCSSCCTDSQSRVEECYQQKVVDQSSLLL